MGEYHVSGSAVFIVVSVVIVLVEVVVTIVRRTFGMAAVVSMSMRLIWRGMSTLLHSLSRGAFLRL